MPYLTRMDTQQFEAKILPDSFSPFLFDAIATHFVQSWEWGAVRAMTHVKVARVGFFYDNVLTNIAQITFHPIPKIGRTFGLLAKCKALNDQELDALIKIGQANRAVGIRIEPDLEKGQWSIHRKDLRTSNRPYFIQHNFLIDLTRSEQDLLANMDQKTRYNIRVAEKHGVTIEESPTDETFEIFLRLQKETADRQKFYLHPDKYYKTVFAIFKPRKMATLLVAKHPDGTILSVWFLVMFKKTMTYLYGASTQSHKDVMANNLLAWEAIKLGQTLGMSTFDFGGTLGDHADPKDPRYGFHKFKRGYGGRHLDYVGSFDLVIEPMWYRFYAVAETIRWALLRLKR